MYLLTHVSQILYTKPWHIITIIDADILPAVILIKNREKSGIHPQIIAKVRLIFNY